MTPSTRSILHSTFSTLRMVLAVPAAASFFMGGRFISDTWHTDRSTGEVFGIVIAIGFALLAFLCHGLAENFDDGDQEPQDLNLN